MRQTAAADARWSSIRKRKLGGFKFRRQHAIGPYVVDFYCDEIMLVIELDGSAHDQTAEQDAERTRWLKASGNQVLRFRNDEVFQDKSQVLRMILAAAVIRALQGVVRTTCFSRTLAHRNGRGNKAG
jgi:very-short-patch-repair endonuclease